MKGISEFDEAKAVWNIQTALLDKGLIAYIWKIINIKKFLDFQKKVKISKRVCLQYYTIIAPSESVGLNAANTPSMMPTMVGMPVQQNTA